MPLETCKIVPVMFVSAKILIFHRVPFFKTKLILSGEVLEVYEYERAIIYDVPLPRHYRAAPRSKVPIFKPGNLFRCRSNLRRLILANVSPAFRPIFCTFTFSANISTLSVAARHFSKFIQRFNYQFNLKLAYVAVPEIQKSREKKTGYGVWHFHCLYFNLPFIPELKHHLDSIWGLGITNYRSVFNSPIHISNYLAKYLTKANYESRLYGRKRVYTSRGLKRPKILRDENEVNYLRQLWQSKIPYKIKKIEIEEYKQSIKKMSFKLSPLDIAQINLLT